MSTRKRTRLQRRIKMMLLVVVIVFSSSLWQQIATDSKAGENMPTALASETAVNRLQRHLEQNPENAAVYAQLGLAYLQQVRETGDMASYSLAEEAFTTALAHEPQQIDALLGQGMLALVRHDFTTSLTWATQARQINPYRADILGVLVDAYVELGAYETAVTTLQEMVDLRPDLASYSRVSYLRELHGDTEGAIAAMQTAVAAGTPGQESTVWAQVQLGHLYLDNDDGTHAERIFQAVLNTHPDHPQAQLGIAQLLAAQGQFDAAIATLKSLMEQSPLPETAILLGDLYQVTGQTTAAQEAYAQVPPLLQLEADAGLDIDLELALFNADQGIDNSATVALARTAYGRRPSVYAADTLAWALYQNGEYEAAWPYSREALRLGTREPLFHYHAGVIAHALGQETAAREHLQTALVVNPAFSMRYGPQAEALLSQLALGKGGS